MILIYVSELQEEAPIDKKHRKREKEANKGSPTLIYTKYCKRIHWERNHHREFPLMSKQKRRNKRKREISKA
jgi:uncharacterized protein with PIN domain